MMTSDQRKLAEFAECWSPIAEESIKEIMQEYPMGVPVQYVFPILLGRGAAMALAASYIAPEWADKWARILTEGEPVGKHPLWADGADLFFSLPIEEEKKKK